MLGRSRGENNSPAGSPFLRSVASWAELLRTTKIRALPVLPQMLRGCSCQGPERHFLCYYTFPDCRILEFGSDHSAADGGGGRPAFSNVRAWPHGGEHLRADTREAVSRSTVPARVRQPPPQRPEPSASILPASSATLRSRSSESCSSPPRRFGEIAAVQGRNETGTQHPPSARGPDQPVHRRRDQRSVRPGRLRPRPRG